MRLKLVTAPAAEPLTTTEAKLWLRVDTSADDGLIDLLVKAAREKVETDLGRGRVRREALITQTWDLFRDEFPGAFAADISERPLTALAQIDLPIVPVQSVAHVKYYDSAGVQQTVSSGDYMVDVDGKPGRLAPIESKSWPSSRGRFNDVVVRFVAGYGAASTDIPARIRAALRIALADMYDRRDLTAQLSADAQKRYDAVLGRGLVFA